MAPVPPIVQEGGGEDIPIIQVDTSDTAMALEGLRQPNDRNLPVIDSLQAANTLKRSRSPRTNAQQSGGYSQQSQGPISVQKDDFQEAPLTSSAPITVVKLG